MYRRILSAVALTIQWLSLMLARHQRGCPPQGLNPQGAVQYPVAFTLSHVVNGSEIEAAYLERYGGESL